MKIKDISKDNRPREKLLNNGVELLSNEELLAILLGSGVKGKSAIELAYKIISDAGNIKELYNKDIKELLKVSGLGPAKASVITASLELTKRALSYSENLEEYDTSKKVFNLLSPLMSLERIEVLYVLLLDNKCRLIKYKKISIGEKTRCLFPIETILHLAIKFECSNIIIAHNHPSGEVMPSDDDIDSTERLFNALNLINVSLIDHLIIGNNKYYSFNDMHIL